MVASNGPISCPDGAPTLVAASRLVAERLSAGGRLLAHGEGRCLADAQHIAVEFLHPVITGRRALPALVGANGRMSGDVVISVAYGGSPPAAGADIVLTDRPKVSLPPGPVIEPEAGTAPTDRAAPLLDPSRRGQPTADGAPTDRGGGEEETGATGEPVVVALPSGAEAKEAAVVAYHVLWEVAHLFLDAERPARPVAPAPQTDRAMASLYPMLYSAPGVPDGDLEEAALASVRTKLAESVTVREQARHDNAEAIERAVEALRVAPTVFTCGNGGSATDAADLAHLLGERGRSLSGDIATVTALSNDVSFEVAFARPLATLGRAGDALVAISTRGSSPNVLAALAGAKSGGLATVGLAGYGGGGMVDVDLDALLIVHSDSVHRIQEAQVCLYSEVVAGCL